MFAALKLPDEVSILFASIVSLPLIAKKKLKVRAVLPGRVYKSKNFYGLVLSAYLLGALAVLAAGCGIFPKETEVNAQSQKGSANRTALAGSQSPTPVDVAIARTGTLRTDPEYTGTTAPVQEVSLRSQVEGQVLGLELDVGDAVKKGQIVGQVDDDLLKTALNQAQAELASLKAEVARAQNQVSNARAQVESARLELQQAQADEKRQQRLLRSGAIATQQAEQAQTTAQTAAQALRASLEQVRTEQQAVAAAQGQVIAQQAVVAQAREQLSYTRLTSPITGLVTRRLTEEGNFVQPNTEVLRIGDFSRVQVDVEVSELELAKIRKGQSVTVRLDAFPNQTFKGKVNRISPAADPTARLVPIEVIIPNNNRLLGSGLLARVSFEGEEQERVVVPQSAVSLVGDGEMERGGDGEIGSHSRAEVPPPPRSGVRGGDGENRKGTVFVVTAGEGGTQATVRARAVTLGERADGRVEILSGLKPGERFVARSGKSLKNGESVRMSILSEEIAQQEGQQ